MSLSIDVVMKVKDKSQPTCRPVIFTHDLDVSTAIVSLMKLCWQDQEYQRPTFNYIKNYMKKNIHQGQ